jgi:hypothetical protein
MVNYIDIWPGVRLTDDPDPWSELKTSSLLSSGSTKETARRRKNGTDTTTFKGMSRKSDELNKTQHAPAMMTAKRKTK